MANQLRLSGVRELRAELAALPTDLRSGAIPILLASARRTVGLVVAAYPEVTGALKAGVKLIPRDARGVAALFTVATTAPHAHLIEFGTARTRPRAIFLPITERERRAAVSAVVALVETTGLDVTGDRT